MRKDDVFNPEYRKERKFWRKKNVKRILVLSFIMGLFIVGAREFVYSNTLKIEIRTVTNRRIGLLNWNINSNEEIFMNYIIINKSPYNVVLNIRTPKTGDIYFETNYNEEILIPERPFHIWFKMINNGIKQTNFGIKIGGERA